MLSHGPSLGPRLRTFGSLGGRIESPHATTARGEGPRGDVLGETSRDDGAGGGARWRHRGARLVLAVSG